MLTLTKEATRGRPTKDGAALRLLHERAFVGGSWIEAADGRTIAVDDPADGTRLGTVPSLGAAEVEAAIRAAHEAQPAWAARTAKERCQILRRWNDLVLAHADDLAMLMTREQGKPLAEAKGEVVYGASFIDWFAEEGRRAYGTVIPPTVGSRRVLVIKQPVGVCAAITPWNFPVAMLTRKVAPGLAAGCSFVVKPASLTPYCALALAGLAQEAGLPDGLLNVITGSAKAIGQQLCASPLVRKLSFTGSTEVGKVLLRQCADTVKRVSMELGGHAPFIVFDDADLEAAVVGALACKFRNAGQTCVCTNRIYVQDGIYDAFQERFAVAVAGLKVGPGTAAGTTVGPLVEPAALEKVREHVADATAKGAQIVVGGKPHALGGLFYEPTILGLCTAEMALAHEETFGPVAPLFRFSSEAEVLKQANDSSVGLAGYFYTRDLARAFRVAEALEVGLVGVNDGIISIAEAPFGGVKESGLGREGSSLGLDEYLEVKYVSLGGIA